MSYPIHNFHIYNEFSTDITNNIIKIYTTNNISFHEGNNRVKNYSIYDIDTMDLMFHSTAYFLLDDLNEDHSTIIKLFSICKFPHNIENAFHFLL